MFGALGLDCGGEGGAAVIDARQPEQSPEPMCVAI